MPELNELTVLVLDDEQMVRENLEAFLEDEGLSPVTATNGEEALSIMATQNVAISIVDMRLPGMAGSEFIVRAHGVSPDTKFLVHTGSTNYKLPKELKEIGVTHDDIFIKPLADMTIVLKAIKRLICD